MDSHEIYEPAEDTYLFVDTLEKEKEAIGKTPSVILEIGCGSGILGVSLLSWIDDLSKSYLIQVDINEKACHATKCLSEKYSVQTECLISSLFSSFQQRPIFDIIICNPPYVPFEGVLEDQQIIDAAWNGGYFGRSIFIEPFISQISKFLTDEGVLYLLIESRNDLNYIIHELYVNGLSSSVISEKKACNELLYILKCSFIKYFQDVLPDILFKRHLSVECLKLLLCDDKSCIEFSYHNDESFFIEFFKNSSLASFVIAYYLHQNLSASKVGDNLKLVLEINSGVEVYSSIYLSQKVSSSAVYFSIDDLYQNSEYAGYFQHNLQVAHHNLELHLLEIDTFSWKEYLHVLNLCSFCESDVWHNEAKIDSPITLNLDGMFDLSSHTISSEECPLSYTHNLDSEFTSDINSELIDLDDSVHDNNEAIIIVSCLKENQLPDLVRILHCLRNTFSKLVCFVGTHTYEKALRKKLQVSLDKYYSSFEFCSLLENQALLLLQTNKPQSATHFAKFYGQLTLIFSQLIVLCKITF